MTSRNLIRTISCVAATGGIVTFVAPTAQAAPVACGATITASVTLTHDILDCPTGITIGADNVNLNLNGHVIDGNGAPNGTNGITVDGRAGVIIRNGKVRGYDDYTIRVANSPRTTISFMNISGWESFGSIRITDSPDTSVLDSTGGWFWALNSDRFRMARSSMSSHAGIEVSGNGVRVTDSKGAASFTSDFEIVGNGNQVLRNTGLYGGIQVAGDNNRVEGNKVDGTRWGLVPLQVTGNNNIIRANVLTNNTTFGDAVSGSLHVEGNSNQLTRNIVSGATNDTGIYLNGTNNVARDNVATNNAVHGIYSTSPVIGTNYASRNATEPQCVNVICKAPPA